MTPGPWQRAQVDWLGKHPRTLEHSSDCVELVDGLMVRTKITTLLLKPRFNERLPRKADTRLPIPFPLLVRRHLPNFLSLLWLRDIAGIPEVFNCLLQSQPTLSHNLFEYCNMVKPLPENYKQSYISFLKIFIFFTFVI